MGSDCTSGGKSLLTFFTRVKVSILQYRKALLQVKVGNSKCTWVKVRMFWHQNVQKNHQVPKSTKCEMFENSSSTYPQRVVAVGHIVGF